MTLKVIGTGFGRTGTDSMRNALNILGVGPTHHMFELEEGSPLRPLWLDLAKGGEPDWGKLFEGYTACVDWPSAYYWRTLINVYPEAKVILTMRSAESWWTSFEATILKYLQSGDDPQGLSHLLVADQVFEGRYADRDYAIAAYNKAKLAGDPPHILLDAHLSQLSVLDFHRAPEAIQEGRRIVEESAEDILKLAEI